MPLTNRDLRIAIIDDDEDDYFIITDYLRGIGGNNFRVDWCDNFEVAKQKINAREYDIYFVDYRLGGRTGLELLQETVSEDFSDPIVLLTGKGNKDIDVKAMQSGAADYLVKSELNTEKLERCIRYSLERAESLKEIRQRENKYRHLFEGSKDAVFISDKDLLITEANLAAVELFTPGNGGLVNHHFYEFVRDPLQRARLSDLFKNKDTIRDLPIEVENLDAETRHCLLSLFFQDSPSGETVVYGILHDITSIREAEIANLQAQKLAANERLMRVLAHEIRNPLNNISLSADQFEMAEGDEEMQEGLVEIIKRNCIRINHIISELLDVTKPPELTFQSYPLQEILDESIAMNSDRINLHKISVVRNYPDEPLNVSANKSKLVIAFTNILINAIEAMETEKGVLTVSMSVAGNQCHVSFRDNGRGIPEEYLSKLFEPFFTLKKNGMGLGLAASYTILQSHSASMRVESHPDQGTNFVISFSSLNGTGTNR